MTEADEQATSKDRALANITYQIKDGYHPGSTMVAYFEAAARRIGCTQEEINSAKRSR